VQAQPRAAEVAVLHEQRNAPMAAQVQVQREAAQNKAQFYSANKGRPAITVAAHPVVADRTPPPTLPRVAGPVGQPAARGEVRAGQAQAAHPEPAPQVRGAPEAARPAPEARQVPQNRPEQQVRPVQPEARPVQPQPQARPVQPQARPEPQARPQEQPRPQTAPRQESAPPPHPQPQARPAPQPPARPAPQPQARPAPPPHPQPAPQPHPQPQKDEPHPDDKPHG
jgi:hypothetical protein